LLTVVNVRYASNNPFWNIPGLPVPTVAFGVAAALGKKSPGWLG
jgi:formate-dependent nitrite reductase membrane component NrfD